VVGVRMHHASSEGINYMFRDTGETVLTSSSSVTSIGYS